jgi:hypothetical protein
MASQATFVAQAERTNATVEILDRTASHIGEVVKMPGRPVAVRSPLPLPPDQWYCIAQSLIRRV